MSTTELFGLPCESCVLSIAMRNSPPSSPHFQNFSNSLGVLGGESSFQQWLVKISELSREDSRLAVTKGISLIDCVPLYYVKCNNGLCEYDSENCLARHVLRVGTYDGN
jgi:hypothetical protein